jgi:NADH:ubiquinone oxidoreductase subunit K
MIPINLVVGVAAALFCIGLFALLTRRNAVAVFMGIELMLNAANLNFVAFSRRYAPALDGQMAAIFVIMLAAAEFAVALALILSLYQTFSSVNVDEAKELKG